MYGELRREMSSNSNTIHVGGKPRSISFSGCGFLGVYHIGVASCLKKHAPDLVQSFDKIYGCSAGSIMGAMLLSDVCFGEVCERTISIVMDARSRALGPLSPGFRLNETLLRDFRLGLPVDVHIRASGKLFVSLTRMRDGKNVIVSDYSSREELIQVLLCSCFVPFYSGLIPPKYRGVYYVDGGLSNNLPADHDTITVSPWSGNSDICPRNDGSVSLIDLSFVNTSIQMTASNMYRCTNMFFPPEPTVLKDFCAQGFRETAQYLRDHGLYETGAHPVRKNLSFSTLLSNVKGRRQMTRRMSFTARMMAQRSSLDEVGDEISTGSETDGSYASAEDFIFDQEMDECFDENANDCDDIMLEKALEKSPNAFTVVHVYPTEETSTLHLQFQLPTPVLDALEAAYLNSTSSWKRPLSSVIRACRTSIIVRVPLDRTYSIATFLLRHATSFPDDVQWLGDHVRKLTEKLQFCFKCQGQELVEKLRNLSDLAKHELQDLAEQMNLSVQLLIKALWARGVPYCSAWLDPILKRNSCGEVSPGLLENKSLLRLV